MGSVPVVAEPEERVGDTIEELGRQHAPVTSALTDKGAQVVVIGGGVTGLSAAYLLAKAGKQTAGKPASAAKSTQRPSACRSISSSAVKGVGIIGTTPSSSLAMDSCKGVK